jgi:hypothetical protein
MVTATQEQKLFERRQASEALYEVFARIAAVVYIAR